MPLSIRAQIYAVCLGLFIPTCVLLYRASGATYREHLDVLTEEATRYARLLADTQAVEAAQPALPPGGVVRVVTPDDPAPGSLGEAGDEWVVAEAPMVGSDRRVRVALPRAIAWERTWPIYRRNYLTAMSATIAVAICAFVLSRRWRAGLTALEQQARRVGAGDRTPVPPAKMPSSEMAAVQLSFSEMEQNLASLERQVVRQERLAAIGVLASGIAHELNNPLQAIAGRAQLVARDPSLGATARTDIDLIQKESARASIIIRNLSRFSRQEAVAPAPLRLSEVITSVVELRQRRLEELGIHLVVDEASRASFLGVLTEFQQVVLNFVVNAEQAMASMKRGQRLLTVRTRDVGARVYCEVEDTGPGVPPEHEPKLFQPFFTTKPVGEGTGLGLSVSHSIIESYGGRIGYRRADGGGAIFWFDAPAT